MPQPLYNSERYYCSCLWYLGADADIVSFPKILASIPNAWVPGVKLCRCDVELGLNITAKLIVTRQVPVLALADRPGLRRCGMTRFAARRRG